MLLGFSPATPSSVTAARPPLVAMLSDLPGHLGPLSSLPPSSSAWACAAVIRLPAEVTAVVHGAADAASAAPTVEAMRVAVSRMTTPKLLPDKTALAKRAFWRRRGVNEGPREVNVDLYELNCSRGEINAMHRIQRAHPFAGLTT